LKAKRSEDFGFNFENFEAACPHAAQRQIWDDAQQRQASQDLGSP
jgi:hypothetical protein